MTSRRRAEFFSRARAGRSGRDGATVASSRSTRRQTGADRGRSDGVATADPRARLRRGGVAIASRNALNLLIL
jgi:hypothetical protein